MRKFLPFHHLKIVSGGKLASPLKLPAFHRLSHKIADIKRKIGKNSFRHPFSFFPRHKFFITTSVASFVIGVIVINGIYIAYFEFPKQAKQQETHTSLASILPTDTPTPTVFPPSDTPVMSDSAVLGTSDYSPGNTSVDTQQTIAPATTTTEPTIDCIGPDGKHLHTTREACDSFNAAWATPTPTIVFSLPSSTGNSPANANCTSGDGVPNAWYSDVYPNPPVTTSNGLMQLIVDIRDCKINLAPVSDKIKITLSSGDPNTRIDGNTLPYTATAKNGEAKFSVSSQNAGTVTLVVQDTTSSFTITNVNNQNPSITFSIPSATSAPTPTNAPTSSPVSSLTPTSILTPTQTPTPTN